MYVCVYVYRTPAAVRSSMALRTSGRMGTEEAAMPRNTCAAHGNALETRRQETGRGERRIREEDQGRTNVLRRHLLAQRGPELPHPCAPALAVARQVEGLRFHTHADINKHNR
jgi:hypothetical protein